MKKLISIKEFFEIIDSNIKYVILDCRFDLMNKMYGIDSYKKGHIPGAFLVDVERDLSDPVSEHGGRNPFKNTQELREILQNYGIDNDTLVITYDDGDMQGAGRLLYQILNLGHKKVCALDGGMISYIHHGGKIETDENIPVKTDKKLDNPVDRSFIVDMEYVKDRLYDENTVIIDSRAYERYLGQVEPVDKVAGHIPSAKSYPYKKVLNDDPSEGSFKSEEFLLEHYKDLADADEIIVYCGSGISLMVNALALDKIGFDFKMYPGSFSDWISYDTNKIAVENE